MIQEVTIPSSAAERFGKLTDGAAWTNRALVGNSSLYGEGQIAERVFIITSGLVKLVTYLPNGRARILGLHGPDAVLGFAAATVPGNGRYTHTAVALGPVKVRCAPGSHLRRLRSSNASGYLDLLERHCATLRGTERWIAEFTADTARVRVARLVLFLAELQKADHDEVELLTCQEIGEIVGTSTENASRTLASLKRAGTLRRIKGTRDRYLYDADALEQITDD